MKKTVLLLFLIFTTFWTVFSNPTDTTKITGKPLFLIYSNFHQGISEAANESNFDVKRAYLGYDFNLNNGFKGFIKIDIGTPDDNSQYSLIRRDAYLRSVGMSYSQKNFILSFGIVDNQQHKTQEKFWGKRYLFKSIIDEYGFLSSTDLGFNFKYKFNSKLSIEGGMMNGEYLSLQNGFLKYVYNFGIDYSPIEQIKLKLHSSYTGKISDIITSGFFIGIKPIKTFRLGAEIVTQAEVKESGRYWEYVYNIFAVYNLTEKINIFARYDVLSSNIPSGYNIPFNLAKNGTAIIGGVEYIINDNIRASLNYQDWYPMAANMQNTAYIYLNFEFGIFESYKRI
ncbi:MAG: hypothetical protein JXR36_04930 [Bacteroidales bacterium]|nr:hypothetical protein [Bacteroidales bacterium]